MQPLLYFFDQITDSYRSDLEGVTKSGYLRLIILAVRALNEFQDSIDVDYAALDVFQSYTCKYCSEATGYSRGEELFKAKALVSIVRSLQKYHITNPQLTYPFWFVLQGMSNTQRTKYLEALCSVGILDLAIDTLKVHRIDKEICNIVSSTLAAWLQLTKVRHVTIPPYDTNALLLNIVVTMKRFPADVEINCCATLSGMLLTSVSRTLDELQDSPLAVSMALMGVYELLVKSIQCFPTEREVAEENSKILGYICKQYFADRSKPRNTEACVALSACLPHHVSDLQLVENVVVAMQRVIIRSPASGAQLLRTCCGFTSLVAALQVHINNTDLLRNCSAVVYFLCGDAMTQLVGSPAYAEVLNALEDLILPVLMQGLELHLHCTSERLMNSLMLGLISIVNRTQKEYPNLNELFREAVRLHPIQDVVRYFGGGYLRSIGL